jgi:putative spermidine/putrescine transport system substrate-binding protein
MFEDQSDTSDESRGDEKSASFADPFEFSSPVAADFTRRDVLRYGLIGGATVFFMGAGSAKAARWAEPPRPAKTPDSIIVRNWGDPWRSFYRDNVAKPFTARTGVAVKWDLTDQFPIMAKARAKIRAGQRPPVDAQMNQATQGFLAWVQKLSIAVDPRIATTLKDTNPAIAKAGGGQPGYTFVGMYSYSTPLIYRTDKFPNGITSWLDLWDSKNVKHIGVCQTYACFTYPLAKILKINPVTDNMAPVWAKLRELRPNIYGILDEPQRVNGLVSGNLWAVPGLVGDGLAARKAGAPIGFAVPREGMVIDRDIYFVHRNIPPENQYYAQLFVNYLVGASEQTKMAAELGVPPVNLKSKLPALMKQIPDAFPVTPAQIKKNIVLPVRAAARNFENWQAQYNRAVK